MEQQTELMCFFSAPQGSWKQSPDKFALNELSNRVEIELSHGKKITRRRGLVVIPSDFIRFYAETLKAGFKTDNPPEWKDAHFRVVQDEGRFYFLLTYSDPALDEGTCSIPLWYWVPSNLPKWIRKAPLAR